MKKIKVAEGSVLMNDKKYRYEFHSDNKDSFVTIFHPGIKGEQTHFKRNDKIGLKAEMEKALMDSGVL